ncbi:cobalt-precorrin-6A reductase [Salinisphaera sp. Q1T1-3]|uniref:cobalt-precorrin-6A reductase n=1 Tax=Salinisphaera sp. Q1T1-3 TaxID=2321229 RepID=UPI0013148498|nr:cobalt-precorrin-6A reductase [Salinisphaera sp. Q1T1-3]
MRLLILGGTGEARRLASCLAERRDIDAEISLAGVTRAPAGLALATRRGGFGGIAGLVRYLRRHAIDCLIDATHPFAARMSHHAVAAGRRTGIPVWRLERPAWRPQAGDRWHPVVDTEHAAARLADFGRHVFLTVGARSLSAFAAVDDKDWLVRSIEPVAAAACLARARWIEARPPFSVAEEMALLRDHAIDVLVTKNSGAATMQSKLDAARQLAVPVLMIERPTLPRPDHHFDDLAWLMAALDRHQKSAG